MFTKIVFQYNSLFEIILFWYIFEDSFGFLTLNLKSLVTFVENRLKVSFLRFYFLDESLNLHFPARCVCF